MRTQSTTVDEAIAAVAARQHGNITRPQLLEVGLSRSGIRRRVTRGSLIPVHRGVYRVGHRAPSVLADYMAAVLACGEGAVLSGMAAAHLHSLVRTPPQRPEVTAPAKHLVPGLVAKRGTPPVTVVRGIPVTTVARTLVDLAATLPEDQLARACHEASVKYGTTPAQVEAALRRNTPGAAALRRVLRGETRVVLSRLEQRFLDLLKNAGLPLPVTNMPAGTHRVDCRWPGLTVELDSYRFHNSRHSWEQDRRREREARARGDDFRRFSWEDVFERPGAMLRELTEGLGMP